VSHAHEPKNALSDLHKNVGISTEFAGNWKMHISAVTMKTFEVVAVNDSDCDIEFALTISRTQTYRPSGSQREELWGMNDRKSYRRNLLAEDVTE
jgi:hypothetical protein